MRCPKCGYVSFDYNQTCPKCNKDISLETAKIGLTSFKPEPPSLLGALIGEADESQTGGLGIDELSNLGDTGQIDAGQGDTDSFEMDDMAIDEGEGSLDFSTEEVSSGDDSLEGDLDVDLDDSRSLTDDSLDIDEPIETESDQETDMDLDLDIGGEREADSLDFNESVSEEPDQDDNLELSLDDGIEEAPSAEPPGLDQSEPEDSLEIELNAISLDEDEMAKLEVNEKVLETPELSSDDDLLSTGLNDANLSESSMIELDIDDLKIDKTGQLEIKNRAEFSEGLKKLTKSKNGNSKANKSNNKADINLKIDDDALNLDLEKLDLEIDIEEPENKIL